MTDVPKIPGVNAPWPILPEQRKLILEYERLRDALLDRFADRVPAAQLKDLRETQFAGEWDYMVSDLMSIIIHDGIPVTTADREAIAEILYKPEDPDFPESLPYLVDPDKTMASLVHAENPEITEIPG